MSRTLLKSSRLKTQTWFTGGALVLCLGFLSPAMAHDDHDHADEDWVHGTSKVENQLVPANRQPPATSKVTITEKNGYRYISSNGLPVTKMGAFPNRGNPHRATVQSYQFKVPLRPVKSNAPQRKGPPSMFGVSLDGVPFDPGTAEAWKNDPRSGWNIDALSGYRNLGLDENHAHVQPGGQYHYHGIPDVLVKHLQAKSGVKNQMLLVGWAADGFPIYANYAYKDAMDPSSGLKKMKAAYVLKEGARPGGNEGPGGKYDGTYVQDFRFVKAAGDLDQHNGRFGVTPEFPKGTYYYMLTETYPFIPRTFAGTPDPSFMKKRPAGGQRGNGGPPRRRF